MVFQRFCKNHKTASSKTLISYWFLHTFPFKLPPKGPLLGVKKYQKRCTRLKKTDFSLFREKSSALKKWLCFGPGAKNARGKLPRGGPREYFFETCTTFSLLFAFSKNATPDRQKHQLTIRNIAISEKSKIFHEFFMKFSLILQKYKYSLWFLRCFAGSGTENFMTFP